MFNQYWENILRNVQPVLNWRVRNNSWSLLVLQVRLSLCGQEVLHERLPTLRALWESTSFQLERLQANPLCVQQEEQGLSIRTQPYLKLTFDPAETQKVKDLG